MNAPFRGHTLTLSAIVLFLSISLSADPSKLAERDALKADAARLTEAKKWAEAMAIVEKQLALERELLGTGHEDVATTLDKLADLHYRRGFYPAAREVREQLLAMRTKLQGEAHWRTVTAKWDLKRAERVVQLTAAEKKRLAERDDIADRAYRLSKFGKARDALQRLENALVIETELFGRDQPGYWDLVEDQGIAARHGRELGRSETLLQFVVENRQKHYGPKHPTVAHAVTQMAFSLAARKDWDRADELLRRAATIWADTYGVKSTDYAGVFNNLGLNELERGNVARAEELIRQSLAGLPADDKVSRAQVLYNLTGPLTARKKWAEADAAFRDALTLCEAAHGKDSEEVHDTLERFTRLQQNWADALEAADDFAAARPHRQQVVTLAVRRYGEKAPEVTDYESDLKAADTAAKLDAPGRKRYVGAIADLAAADPLYFAGKYEEALPKARAAMDGLRATLGDTSLHTGIARLLVGKCLVWLKKPVEAEAELRPALAVLDAVYGEKNDYRQRAVEFLARAAEDQAEAAEAGGDFASAAKAWDRAATWRTRPEAIPSWQVPEAKRRKERATRVATMDAEKLKAFARGNQELARGKALPNSGTPDAVATFRAAVDSYRAAFGEDDPMTATAKSWLAYSLYKAGDLTAAEPIARAAAGVHDRAYGDHPVTALSWRYLGEILQAQGRLAEAEPAYVQALAVMERVTGSTSTAVTEYLYAVAMLYQAMKQPERAEPLLQQALAIQEETFGSESKEYARALNFLAVCADNSGRPAEADGLYARCAPLYGNLYGRTHPEYAFILANHASIVQKLKDYKRAEALSREALAISRAAHGDRHELTVRAADGLRLALHAAANAHFAKQDFVAARDAWAEAVTVSKTHFNPDDGRIRAMATNLTLAEKMLALDAAGRAKVKDADAAMELANKELKQRRFMDAARSAAAVVALREDTLGKDHLHTGEAVKVLALARLGLKDYPAAAEEFRRVLTINIAVAGKSHTLAADAMIDLADLSVLRADDATAEPLFRDAAAIREKMLGPAHALTAAVFDKLAMLHGRVGGKQFQAGEFVTAAATYQKQLAIRTQRHGVKDYRTTDARLAVERAETYAKLSAEQRAKLADADKLHQDANAALTAEQFAEAATTARKAYAIRRDILGKEHITTARTTYLITLAEEKTKDVAQTNKNYREVLRLYRLPLGDNHPETAIVLNSFASYFVRAHYSPSARPLVEEALAIRRKAFGDTHPTTAQSYTTLGDVLLAIGEYGSAERHFRQSLDIARATSGPASLTYARQAARMASVFRRTGNFAAAEPLARQAYETVRKERREKNPETINTLDILAKCEFELGDFDRAEPHAKEVVAARKGASGPAAGAYADALATLADILSARGRGAEGEKLLEEAAAVRKAAFGEKDRGASNMKAKLAAAALARGDVALAESMLRDVVQSRTRADGEETTDLADALLQLAETLRVKGEFADAETLAARGTDVRRRLLGDRNPTTAAALAISARILADAGKADRAAELLRQSLDVTREYVRRTAAIQSERQQLATVAQVRAGLDLYLSVTRGTDRPAADVYEHVLSWKGLVFAQQAQTRDLRGAVATGGDPALAKLYTDLEATVNRLAAVSLAAGDGNMKAVRDLTEQQEKLEAELARKSESYRNQLQARHLTAAQLGELLPADAVLVDLLEYTDTPPKAKPAASARRLVAFVVRKGKPVERIELGPVAPVAEAVTDWRVSVKRTRPVMKPNDAAVQLRSLLLAPLDAATAGAKVVVISPDGVVSPLPFAALPGSDPEKYWIEEVGVAVLPVPQLLPALFAPVFAAASDGEKESGSLLLLGDVEYGDAPAAGVTATRTGLRRDFKPLDGTVGEILVVRKHFERRFKGAKVQLLEGDGASEADFRTAAGRFRWMHLATHGFFTEPKPRAGGDAETARHPGLLSGLALANANAPPEPDKDDGILTALEVAQLDLRRVEMVVLSACETGLGRVVGGEGVLGLQRAFQVAGARCTIGSLWSVDDDATRKLMERFYENLCRKKMPRLDALHEAQLWMLREGGKRGLVRDEEPADTRPERTPPFYWAAFVLSGDWR